MNEQTQFIFSSINRILSQLLRMAGMREMKKKVLNARCMLMTHIFSILLASISSYDQMGLL